MQLQLHLFCLFFTLIIKKFRRTEKVSVLRNLKNQANLPLIFIFFQKLVNLIRWRLYTGNGYIVVQGIDDGCQEFAHICFLIIRAGQQFLRTIIQICSYDFADVAFFVIFIEFRQPVGEKTKRCADKNTTCLTLLTAWQHPAYFHRKRSCHQ